MSLVNIVFCGEHILVPPQMGLTYMSTLGVSIFVLAIMLLDLKSSPAYVMSFTLA